MSSQSAIVLAVVFFASGFVGRWLHRAVQRFREEQPLTQQLKSLWTVGDCRGCGGWESGLQHLPLLGWLLMGRCRHCGRRLETRRPVIELGTAILLTLLYWIEIPDLAEFVPGNSGLTSGSRPPGPEAIELWSPMVWLHLRYLLHAVMCCGLIVATAIDWERCTIPDGCTLPVMMFALPFSFLVGQVHVVPLWFQDRSVLRILQESVPDGIRPLLFDWDAVQFSQLYPHWHGLLVSVLGLLAGALVTWLVRAIGFRTLRKEAMGDGDVVLMAMIGSVIGWQPVLTVFFLGAFLALGPALFGRWLRRGLEDEHLFPFGPWLSLAAVLLLLCWQTIWPGPRTFFDYGMVVLLAGFVMFAGLAMCLLLVRVVAETLGLADYSEYEEDEVTWSSADHLSYYNSERPDEQTGQWARNGWPGSRSGRGLSHGQSWRRT